MLSGLRFRLLGLVLLALAPALGLTIYSDLQARQQRATEAGAQALRLARIASADQQALVSQTRDLLVTLAELPEVRSDDATSCQPLLARLLPRYPRYANLGLIGTDGTLICSAVPTGAVYLGDRRYFQEALRSANFAAGDPQVGRVTQRATINFAYPVLDDHREAEGVVFAALDLTWLGSYAAAADFPPGASFEIFDQNGNLLVRGLDPQPLPIQTPGDIALVGLMKAQSGPGTAETTGPDGVARIYGFVPLVTPSAAATVYIAIGFPTQLVYAEADMALLRDLVVLGLVIVVSLAAARLVADVLVLRPVQALVTAAGRLELGDLQARTGLAHGQDELGRLSQAFDDMAEALERAEVERQQQEVLRREKLDLEQRNRAVEEANRLKTEFVSMVSHELRTPLTSIVGYVDLLVDGEAGELAPDQYEYLTIVKNNAARLLSLIDDLLDIARIEAGRIELQPCALDVGRLLREATASLAPMLEAKQQRLALDLAQSMPPVWADPDRLTQIVLNLVSNAHKYTPAAGSISVAAEMSDGCARVHVRDSGVGMSAEEQAQLFTRFFRARNPATRHVSGSGLGLALTRSLVELHGGTLSVTSAPDQGSTFSFTLPVADVPAIVGPELPDAGRPPEVDRPEMLVHT
jgi:signal transduction histidine kinase